MSAFSPIWKDIDNTKPGTPYVVDSDGWGWFLIFIIIAVPFLIICGAVFQISSWICEHPILSLTAYLLVSLVIGIFFYSRFMAKHRVCGIIATVISMMPLGAGVGLYAIPYVMLDNSFSSIFDWILVAALLFGVMYFIFSICNLLKNGLTHLIIAIVFLAISCFFIFGLISSESDIITWEAIKRVYGT